MITTNAFDYINIMDKAADASWKRESAISNNIANADTPGYKRQDVDFESALKRELGSSKYIPLDKKVRGLNSDLSGLDVSTYTDSSNYSYRLDRNNVDVDTEQVELASEQLRYEMLTTSINEEFKHMGLFQSFDISASGMTAERFRIDTIAENIANVNTTRTENGEPYRRKIVTFAEKDLTPFSKYYQSSRARAVGNGVKVPSVKEDTETDFTMEYDPSHPDADENGYVRYPNVNTVTEMTNLIDASRAYEANTTAFNASKSMIQAALKIGQ